MQIHCIVKPKSKTDSISLNKDGTLRIKIKAPPVDGKANEYLVKYLSGIFDLPKKHIEIISGFTNSRKRLNIVAAEEKIRRILQEL